MTGLRPERLPSRRGTAAARSRSSPTRRCRTAPTRLRLACRPGGGSVLRQGPDDHRRTTTPPTRSGRDHDPGRRHRDSAAWQFTPDGKDLLVTSHLNMLYRVDTTTWADGAGLVLRPHAVRLRRSRVASRSIGDQLFVTDGGLRPVGDPLRYAVFVFDLVDGTGAPDCRLHRIADHGHRAGRRRPSSTAAPAYRPVAVELRRRVDVDAARPGAHLHRAGVYTVTLTVTNAKGTASVTQTDLVTVAESTRRCSTRSSPRRRPRGPRRSPCSSPTRVSVASTAWAWDFGDGTTSTEQNPAHAYAANGKYTVKLTVTSPDGHQHPDPHELHQGCRAPDHDHAGRRRLRAFQRANSNFGTAATLQGYRSGNGNNAPCTSRTCGSRLGRCPRPGLGRAPPVRDRPERTERHAEPDPDHLERDHDQLQQPTRAPSAARSAPAETRLLGQWVEFDVTSTVTGAGQYGFTLTNQSNDTGRVLEP